MLNKIHNIDVKDYKLGVIMSEIDKIQVEKFIKKPLQELKCLEEQYKKAKGRERQSLIMKIRTLRAKIPNNNRSSK